LHYLLRRDPPDLLGEELELRLELKDDPLPLEEDLLLLEEPLEEELLLEDPLE
jgi:hypothetical protein